MGEIPIPLRTGQKIRVKDIGEVQDTLAEETGYATANGQTTIVMVLYKQSGGNTVAIAESAKEKSLNFKKLCQLVLSLKPFRTTQNTSKAQLTLLNLTFF